MAAEFLVHMLQKPDVKIVTNFSHDFDTEI